MSLQHEHRSSVERLAAFFKTHPNEWISALDLMPIAGELSWRTRVSDARRLPHNLIIENRQRKVDGRTVSEYRSVVVARETYAKKRRDLEGGISPLLF